MAVISFLKLHGFLWTNCQDMAKILENLYLSNWAYSAFRFHISGAGLHQKFWMGCRHCSKQQAPAPQAVSASHWTEQQPIAELPPHTAAAKGVIIHGTSRVGKNLPNLYICFDTYFKWLAELKTFPKIATWAGHCCSKCLFLPAPEIWSNQALKGITHLQIV